MTVYPQCPAAVYPVCIPAKSNTESVQGVWCKVGQEHPKIWLETGQVTVPQTVPILCRDLLKSFHIFAAKYSNTEVVRLSADYRRRFSAANIFC